MTLTGGAMFVGLMVGGVLADRYERKKVILLARGTCGIGFIGLCLNALLPEPSLLAIYWFMGWFFRITWCYGATSQGNTSLVGRENFDPGRGDHHVDRASGVGDFAHDWRFIASDRWRSLELRAGGGGHVYYLATVVKPSGVATATAAARASVEIITGRISFSARQPAGRRDCAAGWFIDDRVRCGYCIRRWLTTGRCRRHRLVFSTRRSRSARLLVR